MKQISGNKLFVKALKEEDVEMLFGYPGGGAISTASPYFIGSLGMHDSYAANMAISNCDVLFSIGSRFNDRITGKLHAFAPNAQIIHIVADAKEALLKMDNRDYEMEGRTSSYLQKATVQREYQGTHHY